jgi:hypothetical protein
MAVSLFKGIHKNRRQSADSLIAGQAKSVLGLFDTKPCRDAGQGSGAQAQLVAEHKQRAFQLMQV